MSVPPVYQEVYPDIRPTHMVPTRGPKEEPHKGEGRYGPVRRMLEDISLPGSTSSSQHIQRDRKFSSIS